MDTDNSTIDENSTDFKYEMALKKLKESSIYSPITALYVMTVLDAAILAIGLIGNLLVVLVIVYNRSMRTVTNYYLLNLAVTDLVHLLINAPAEIALMWETPFKYRTLCFLRFWLLETLIYVSILTITAFSIERYLAICRPFRIRTSSLKPRIVSYILGIWSVALTSGYLIGSRIQYDETNRWCYYENDVGIRYLFNAGMLVFFVLPMTVLTVLYALIGVTVVRSGSIQKHQGRSDANPTGIDASTKRTLQMLATVVAVFFLCWAPFQTMRMLSVYRAELLQMSASAIETFMKAYYLLTLSSRVLYVFNAAANPIIYSVMSKKFKDAFKEVIRNVCYVGPKSTHSTSGTNATASTELV